MLQSPPAAVTKEPTLNWLTAALRSSVGKKFVMGITGLFLCLFLVVHLGGNLLLYVGPDAYNRYAHALHGNPLFLVAAQVLLYGAFMAHIYLAFVTSKENQDARGTSYAVNQTKRRDRTLYVFGWSPDTTMFVTGAVVLGFLIVHLCDFKFEWFWGDQLEGQEPFDKAGIILADSARILVYVIGSLFLGVHVAHGFASAFQSLGINHPKYNRCIQAAGFAFAVIVVIGFASFPVLWKGVGSGPTPTRDAAPGDMAPDAPATHSHSASRGRNAE